MNLHKGMFMLKIFIYFNYIYKNICFKELGRLKAIKANVLEALLK